MSDRSIRIAHLSDDPSLLPVAVELVEEYLRLPDAWQGIVPDEFPSELRGELVDFPGNARPPGGEVAVATEGETGVAVGILRPVSSTAVEMKRLYVRPRWRRAGVGRAVVEQLTDLSASLGYAQLVLDVMTARVEAVALYRTLGFADVEPYRTEPTFIVPLTTLGLDLRSGA